MSGTLDGLRQRLARLWRWLSTGYEPKRPVEWLYCPICGARLVGPPAGFRARDPYPVWIQPTRAELVAKCPNHGRAPYNSPRDDS